MDDGNGILDKAFVTHLDSESFFALQRVLYEVAVVVQATYANLTTMRLERLT